MLGIEIFFVRILYILRNSHFFSSTGPRFSRFMMTKLCETNVWLAPGSVITKVRHTRLGDQVCRDVCARHRDNMCRNQCTPVKVSTLNAYCELHGTSDGPVNVEHVGNTCECLYKVKSDKTSEVVQYTFETNPLGDVRVSVVNSDRRCFVTAMYPSPAQYLQEPRFPTDG